MKNNEFLCANVSLLSEAAIAKQFLPSDAMHIARSLLSAGVRPSVRHLRLLYPDG